MYLLKSLRSNSQIFQFDCLSSGNEKIWVATRIENEKNMTIDFSSKLVQYFPRKAINGFWINPVSMRKDLSSGIEEILRVWSVPERLVTLWKDSFPFQETRDSWRICIPISFSLFTSSEMSSSIGPLCLFLVLHTHLPIQSLVFSLRIVTGNLNHLPPLCSEIYCL